MAAVASVPVLRPVGCLQASVHGGSHPLVLRLEDGRPALVKFKGNPQTTRALTGDLLGTLLGRRIGAAFPEPVLVRVVAEDRTRVPALIDRTWNPGLQFGTIFHLGASPLRDAAKVPNLVNLERLPATMLAEAWLYNTDMKRTHVLAVRGTAGAEFVVVDHGHVFPGGPAWTEDQLAAHIPRMPSLLTLTRVARSAGGQLDFLPAVAGAQGVSDAELAAIVAEVPLEWGLGVRESAAVLSFLVRRRAYLPRWAEKLAAKGGGG